MLCGSVYRVRLSLLSVKRERIPTIQTIKKENVAMKRPLSATLTAAMLAGALSLRRWYDEEVIKRNEKPVRRPLPSESLKQ